MLRICDIFLSLFGLIILFPLLILLCLIGFLDNGSPFFFQTRIGLNFKKFSLIKLRSMPANTKSTGTHLTRHIKLTYFGKFLRKTKLDETTQLFNVLIGQMSLVGPRPCLINQYKLIKERKKRDIFKIKPGITGLAQINGINMSTPNLLAKTDYKMIKQMNIFYYFYYIFKTVLLIFNIKIVK